MSKYNILFIAGWYPNKRTPHLGLFVKEHAKAISLHNNIIVLYNEGVDNSLDVPFKIVDKFEDELRTIRIRYRKYTVLKTGYLFYIWTTFVALKRLIREGFYPDIIHANIYISGVPAILMKKFLMVKGYNVPVVITEHYSGFILKKIKGFNKLKTFFAFNQVDLVLPVSKHLEKHIKKYGIKNDFQVVPNVVDTKIFYPDKHKQTGRIKNIIIATTLSPLKGISYLIEALSILRKKRDDFILHILGKGPYWKEYRKLAFKLNIEDKVNFYGGVEKEQVAHFMRKSDFYVLPSLCETFGVVIIEAFASGIPVVATNCGPTQEIINKDVGLLVPPANANELANSINYMLDNYYNYSQENLVRYARKNYSKEAVASKLNNIYKKLVRNSSKK